MHFHHTSVACFHNSSWKWPQAINGPIEGHKGYYVTNVEIRTQPYIGDVHCQYPSVKDFDDTCCRICRLSHACYRLILTRKPTSYAPCIPVRVRIHGIGHFPPAPISASESSSYLHVDKHPCVTPNRLQTIKYHLLAFELCRHEWRLITHSRNSALSGDFLNYFLQETAQLMNELRIGQLKGSETVQPANPFKLTDWRMNVEETQLPFNMEGHCSVFVILVFEMKLLLT